MEIALILKSIMGLVVLLAILIFLLFLSPEKEKDKVESKRATPSKKEASNIDFDHLRAIIKKKSSTTSELQKALNLIIKYHGTIHKKLGLRTHPDFDMYMEILFRMCRHPNTNKDMVVKFDKDLGQLNPEYKQEINEAITKGLNSRRV